jgi:hypothetical protein
MVDTGFALLKLFLSHWGGDAHPWAQKHPPYNVVALLFRGPEGAISPLLE